MAASSLNLESALAAYGRAAKAKLSAVAARGEPEDQLRSPIEQLIADLAQLCGLERRQLTLVGESSIAELKTRPDFAVSYADTLIGFIEVKAPGKGADPRRFKTPHDRDQWRKLTALPNLIYTDGNAFSLWRNGELVRSIQHLRGDIESAGATLAAPTGLLALFDDFFRWLPVPPRTAAQLADITARLCRLLRDEVTEQLVRGDPTLLGLAKDWRQLLFPEASDEQFADGYAQAVTFGLLLARAQDIRLDDGVDAAARTLSARHSLIGAALRVLTDAVVANQVLATSAATLSRVLAVVDWPQISKGDPDAWLYFYEDFLGVYDNELRKQTGSYYTPVAVVKAMARLVDEALRDQFALPDGLASQSVTLADPAMGTGTFLLEVVRSIATTVAEDQGEGAVPAAVSAALGRLIGFELQLGPFAVAQLRMLAELASLGTRGGSPNELRMFVTNTLDNPYQEEQRLGTWYEPIAASHREANRIKADEPILVVLGNPPYKEKSRGKGGWIEAGNQAASQFAPMVAFLPPPDWRLGPHIRHLYNPYVYFWRWGTWKVFDHHPDADRGIVCFITASGFVDGQGFQRMRDYLRRRADAIYVIDCSPEGHQPPIGSRVFQGVQQPVCITMAIRDGSTKPETPAPVWFRQLAVGAREDKFSELASITLAGGGWVRCPEDWRAPFLPAGGRQWSSYLGLDDLLRWSGAGIMSGRAWIVAPDKPTLHRRWTTLIGARAEDKPELFNEHKQDRRVDTVLSDGLPGFPANRTSIGEESGPCPEPVPIGYRSFDRQWIIPDKRLINRPNPTLWSMRSSQQLYLTVLQQEIPSSGPAVTFTAEIPDVHHYRGNFGGRVFPLRLDAAATVPNIVPGLLDQLSRTYQHPVAAEDVFSYLAAVLAHPGYVEVFAQDLTTPGIRIPLTTIAEFFARAVAIGRKVVWLQTYGQRLTDPGDDRPRRAPRLPPPVAPKVLAGHPIPSDPDGMPDLLDYDPQTQQLHVGSGRISNVTPRMWSYDISGVNVLNKWFSYRRKTREHPVMGDRRVSRLQAVQPDRWLADYTSELIDLLNVIGLLVELEPAQHALLTEIASGPTITTDDLAAAGILPVPLAARKPPRSASSSEPTLLSP